MVVVLFEIETSSEVESAEYKATSRRMHELVEAMPGYISAEDFVGEDGREVSMVRFESLEALEAWRDLPEHVETQKRARQGWYTSYHVEVLTTVREYAFKEGEGRVNLYPPRA